jgi:poly(3-hydroxybutyrate) depolymerase
MNNVYSIDFKAAGWLAAIVGLVLVLPGNALAGWCDDATFPGELRQGIWRNTRVQVPAGTTGDVTLLVVLHPYLGAFDYLFHTWGADLGTKVAIRQTPTIAIYPRGHWFAWNAYNIHLHLDPGNPQNTPRVDDIGFLNSIISKTRFACGLKDINVAAVKLIGYSNGATLALNYLEAGAHRPLAAALIAPPPGGAFNAAGCGGGIPYPPAEVLTTVTHPDNPLFVSMIIGDKDRMDGGCVPGYRWDTPFWQGEANLYDRLWNAMGLETPFFNGDYKHSVDPAQGQSLLAIKCKDMNHFLETGPDKNKCNTLDVWDLALRTIGMP